MGKSHSERTDIRELEHLQCAIDLASEILCHCVETFVFYLYDQGGLSIHAVEPPSDMWPSHTPFSPAYGERLSMHRSLPELDHDVGYLNVFLCRVLRDDLEDEVPLVFWDGLLADGLNELIESERDVST